MTTLKMRNLSIPLLILSILFFSVFINSCQNQAQLLIAEAEEKSIKQKGIHLFGDVDSTNSHYFENLNVKWITYVPWGYQKDHQTPYVRHHNNESSYIKKSDLAWIKRIQLAKSLGYKVFIKPHLWLDETIDNKWRSEVFPNSEEDWLIWQKSYRDFIFRYVRIAEESDAEMFCIGVEFTRLSLEKPEFWRSLIKDIRKEYSGMLVYAANWHEEYEKISFWEHLDYIGVQAYFPLTEVENPSVEQLNSGWVKYLESLEEVADRNNKKIIFTELGYKSTSTSAIKPWEWAEKFPKESFAYSPETQVSAYISFFESVWPQEWFHGVHLWQFNTHYFNRSTEGNIDFTPQGKPTEDIIREGFQ